MNSVLKIACAIVALVWWSLPTSAADLDDPSVSRSRSVAKQTTATFSGGACCDGQTDQAKAKAKAWQGTASRQQLIEAAKGLTPQYAPEGQVMRCWLRSDRRPVISTVAFSRKRGATKGGGCSVCEDDIDSWWSGAEQVTAHGKTAYHLVSADAIQDTGWCKMLYDRSRVKSYAYCEPYN